MIAEKRKIYRDLIKESDGWGLCNFCRYAEWCGSCCDADLDCIHPLSDKSPDCWDVWQGDDCWRFRPRCSFQEIGVMVGIRLEGNNPHHSKTYGEIIAIIPSENDLKYI